MLLNPKSNAVDERAKNLNLSSEEYRKQIEESIKFLKKLQTQGKKVEIKLYNNYPFWKFIILDRYIWIQQYPKNKHVQDSPCYAFFRLEKGEKGEKCLYSYFKQHFLNKWKKETLEK